MRADVKKQQIIDATTRLLLKQGARKTSMEEIAEFCGASKVTVYKYFADKSTIFSSVCEWLTNRCIKQLQEQTEQDADPATRMAGFTQVYSEFLGNGQQSLCIELSLSSSRAESNYAAFEKAVCEMILALIRDGKRAQLIDSALEDEIMYHYIDMGFNYYQNNTNYRERMQCDPRFRNTFLLFLWRNIFVGETFSGTGWTS